MDSGTGKPQTDTTPKPQDASDTINDVPDELVSEKDQQRSLKSILSMKVPVIVKIVEKKMPLASILKFNLGSMISFDKDSYQHIDLMVNNSTIGLGQPIKIGENFGLKITQIGDITDTIKSLGQNEEKNNS